MMPEDIIKEKDYAMLPGRVIMNPSDSQHGGRYSDERRAYQGIPGIERAKGGRLFLAFYSGTEGEGAGNFVLLYRERQAGSYDFEQILAIEPPMNKCRAFDPCLWIDPRGRLWVFYSQGYGHIDSRFGVWCVVCDDPDAEELKFSEPRRIANGIMMNKPTVLKNGSWLLPCTIWKRWISPNNDIPEEQYSNVYLSEDLGESFRLIGHADYPKRTCDEHMIVERSDGRLMMLIRGDKWGIGRAFSDDGGHTWYGEEDYVLGGPDSRFFIRRLSSGRLLMINHHDYGGKRCNVKAMLSEDDGESWQGFLMIDEREGAAYPDAVEDSDGNIHLVYDYNRYTDKEIYMAKIREEDILAGRVVCEGSRLKILVSKALGENNSGLK